ncbi:hypothetical protein KAFR_0A02190 [Kazachstania africana CBS 2517]|uniref:Large ribosomal subunit protein mL44 n=1 Tax=Kazachstania africana (strain ATCC 22294 / BCRC 22015 / CBS 2517 / CECT 1963 / NBRC 1671 / NRRL Y-8276) TaxID=1071382 RepID=H2AMQ7_KAZAF|nr:hypothetical protein KAFR_0A02190 [Kazachstania africana CBS 2517]CCF55657.1 hypothetical protein KAFR_0A02190 [Kazachstania africana CBS 2517]
MLCSTARSTFSNSILQKYLFSSLRKHVFYRANSTLTKTELGKYEVYYKNLQTAINETPETIISKSPTLTTLHKRIGLPKEFTLSNLSKCLTCRSSFSTSDSLTITATAKQADNHGLNIFGKNLLTFHVTKFLLMKYPRLPTVVLNAAINAYISKNVLANIARSWGVEVEQSTIMKRFLKNEPISVTLGKLRYYNNEFNKVDGIEMISKLNYSENDALALFVRSVISVLWTINEHAAVDFIYKYILSRKLDISKLFYFENPTRELARLCERENFQKPVSKLIAESGRLSKAPVFIIGVFSGEEKLGEGYGSSLKEAKARAATDALMKWYAYEAVQNSKQEPLIDPGTVIV